jgi:NADPH:quinone reductase-like Zn-dependent oxidoreductase
MDHGEVGDPEVRDTDALVEVRAASVNPVDYKVRSGMLRVVTGSRFPRVLGGDLAGVVRAVGARVTAIRPGDEVYGAASAMGRRDGSHAERVALDASKLRRKPPGLSFDDAAALPVAALTALHGLRQCPPLNGLRLLCTGATGGVGHYVVQVAKARGVRVTAVCSGKNADLARTLGAQDVVDYTRQDVAALPDRYDVVFDAHAGMGPGKAARLLGPGGVYLSTLPAPGVYLRGWLNRVVGGPRVVVANMRDQPGDYAELEDLLASGLLKPVIEQRFPLARGVEAFAALEGGRARGKIIITVP